MTIQADGRGRPAFVHLVADHTRGHDDFPASSCDLLDAWLHQLGPTATVLWMHLADRLRGTSWRRLDPNPQTTVAIDELARWAGVQPSVVWHALDRFAFRGPAVFVSADVLLVPLWAWKRDRRPRHDRRHRESVPS